jgi:hypothetical protein
MNWNRWNPFKPFSREKAEVADILKSVLAGTMDCRDWDDFISIPIKGVPELDRVRAACEALADQEKIEESGMMSHSDPAREKIRTLLSGLKEDSNQKSQPTPTSRRG